MDPVSVSPLCGGPYSVCARMSLAYMCRVDKLQIAKRPPSPTRKRAAPATLTARPNHETLIVGLAFYERKTFSTIESTSQSNRKTATTNAIVNRITFLPLPVSQS